MKIPGFIAVPIDRQHPTSAYEAVAPSRRAADLSGLLDTAQRRLQRLGLDDLFDWTELAASGVLRSISDMRKGERGVEQSPQEEARLAVHTLALAVEELVRRLDA